MNIGDLVKKVRTQADVLNEIVPTDDSIKQFLEEAFIRTIAAENQWPFYEQTWQLNQIAGDFFAALPGDAKQTNINSLYDLEKEFRLDLVDFNTAEDRWSGLAGAGEFILNFSLWGGLAYFWPRVIFEEDKAYRLRGYRASKTWDNNDAAEPDCDLRLHMPLAHFATALVYAQQEDEQLEDVYMGRWQRDVEIVRESIMEPIQQRPLEMGPHYITPIGAATYGRTVPAVYTIHPPAS